VDVVDLGVLPTPGVAYLSEQRGIPAAMVSASHNPFGDNGIKLFGAGGTKLTVEVEAAIEREIGIGVTGPGPIGRGVGRISADPGGVEAYRAHLRASLDGRRLDGLRVVLDCANGAASGVAPGVFELLGAEVTSTACEPDGVNINHDCGSTHPEGLAAAVVRSGADLGLAFDGDADRLLAVDHTGAIADGDALLALFAVDLSSRGELTGDTVVVTVMTNLGFRLAMAERGIGVRETPVGDRHVLAALDAEGLALGGEQSGHIVFRPRATTGDGILTGLVLADLVVRAGRPLADLSAGLVVRVPQVLANVAVADPGRLAEAKGVWDVVAAVEAELGGTGRVLLRPSGTEPLVRVMVEAVSEDQAAEAARRLCAVVEGTLG
jgi:phosphoglucosamine mutase